MQEVLDCPEDYIESQEYFSWERYFTALLIACTKDSYLSYSKGSLNETYLHDKMKNAILGVMENIKLYVLLRALECRSWGFFVPNATGNHNRERTLPVVRLRSRSDDL